MNIKGFTLSELLIVMVVIGVLAVLLVPNVTRNIFNKSYVVKLQTTVKDIEASVSNMMVEERVTDLKDGSLYYDVSEFLDKYLTITVDCVNTSRNCLPTSPKTIETASGSTSTPLVCSQNEDDNFEVLLPSGAAVRFCPSGGVVSSNAIGFFNIDVNGPEAPNVYGRDYYTVELFPDGSVGYDTTSSYDASTLRNSCHSSVTNAGLDCYVLLESNNWEMDY